MNELPSKLARVIYDAETIQKRVAELAAQISADYADKKDIYLVGILKGSFIFLADLARALTVKHTVDFMALSSYGMGGAFSGEVRIVMDLREMIVGKHVLIVEDILDSGKTLNYLHRLLGSRKPASLRTCVLIRKERDDITPPPVDYLGFEIPDVWVVGYGLDFAEAYRTLPYIAEVDKAAVGGG